MIKKKYYHLFHPHNQTTLQPDIVTEIGQDALEQAIAYLDDK